MQGEMQGNQPGEFLVDLRSVTKLTMTVFNTGMTDLEKRKRYLMDLLAEKLKSSKVSNYFSSTNYRTLTVFLDKTHFSSCFSTSNVSGRQ